MGDETSDDPFAPRDGTVLRPRPGGGRRPGGDFPGSSPAAPRPASAPAPLTPAGAVAALTEFSAGARNPILDAAAPLLILAARLGVSVQPANIATLRQQAVQEIRNFDERMRTAGVPHEDALVGPDHFRSMKRAANRKWVHPAPMARAKAGVDAPRCALAWRRRSPSVEPAVLRTGTTETTIAEAGRALAGDARETGAARVARVACTRGDRVD